MELGHLRIYFENKVLNIGNVGSVLHETINYKEGILFAISLL